MIDCSDHVTVSVVSCWEAAYLANRNRIILSLPIDEWLQVALDESGVKSLPLTAKIATMAASLPDIHRDPVDRFIIASAIELGATLLMLDSVFKHYPELIGFLHHA